MNQDLGTFGDMEERISEKYSKEGKRIRFIRLWGYDNGPTAQVYYYNADGTPGWATFRPAIGFEGSRIPEYGQYDDMLFVRNDSGEMLWVAVLRGGEERFRI